MKYLIAIEKNEDGYTASCPGLPGCWSQGDSREQAIENIHDAIITWLDTAKILSAGKETDYLEVAIV